jgi:histidinol-phosphate aminotransferase
MVELKKLVRRNILDLLPYSSARDEFSGTDGVFLDANENPFGELNRYPDPYQKALKTKLSILKSIPTENIFSGNGSDEVIDLAYRIFCTPGVDKALTFSPTYGMYEVSAKINDVELITLPLNESFQIDFDSLEPFLKDEHLKLIFICSPNNPTGNIIRDIDFLLQKFKGIVFVDEAYIDFTCNESHAYDIEDYPNLIVSQTLSKAWGLAAARIGVAYAVPEIISIFNKVKPPYNISELNQQAAIEALDQFSEFQKRKAIILEQRKRLEKILPTLSVVERVYRSDANFLLVEVCNANAIYAELVNRKVITRNRSGLVRNCIRITVGSPEENEQLINAFKELSQ